MDLFNLKFRDVLGADDPNVSKSAFIAELESIVKDLSAWALQEHNEDGTHNTLPSGFGFIPVGGMIQWQSTTTPPPNWFLCNGALVSRAAYPLLFKAIGISAGAGDGVNTFKIPTVANFIILAA